MHCSLIESTIHWTDGRKNEATSELYIYIYIGRNIILEANLPKKLQLARANVEVGVSVTNGTELDILGFICIPKPEFGTLVETFFYVGYIP